MKKKLNVYLMLVGIVLITACGWHFRGDIAASLNIDSIAIEGGRQDAAFYQRLSQVLERSGVQVTSSAEADLILKIGNILRDRKPLTISVDGAVEEYQLYYVVVISIQLASGEWAIRDQSIEVVRSYRFDRTQVLAKENEERRLYSDMHDNAIRRILQRLKAVKSVQSKVEAQSTVEQAAESAVDEN